MLNEELHLKHFCFFAHISEKYREINAKKARFDFDKPYTILTNQRADPNAVNALSVYTHGSKTKQAVGFTLDF